MISLITSIDDNSKFSVCKRLIECALRDFWKGVNIEAWIEFCRVGRASSVHDNDLELVFQFIEVQHFVMVSLSGRLGADIRKASLYGRDDFLESVAISLEARFGGIVPANLMRAYLFSIISRDAAAAMLGGNLIEHQNLIQKSNFETGAWTYFSSKDVESYESRAIGEISEHLWLREAVAREASRGDSPVVLVSCDAVYFRRLSYLFSIARIAYPRVRFHFVVTESEADARLLLEDFDVLERTLLRFRGQGEGGGVGVSALPSPSRSLTKTFAACARYLVAQQISDFYRAGVLIMDADMLMEDDPSAFFRNLSKFDVSAGVSRGLMSLVPWRRIFAGSLYFSPSALGGDFISSAKSYIELGFERGARWYLDQNALTYAYERHRLYSSAKFSNNHGLSRTIQQRGLCKKLLVI